MDKVESSSTSLATGKRTRRTSLWVLLLLVLILGLDVLGLFMIGGVIPGYSGHHSGCEGNTGSTAQAPEEPITENDEITITKSFYGRSQDGEDIHKYLFKNKNNLQMEVLSLGGIIKSLKVPCRHGHLRDIIVGYDQPKSYIEDGNPPYFGALIGRVANRISNGRFSIDGTSYQLKQNEGTTHLHGGIIGWSKKVWQVTQQKDHISLSYVSPDGEEGYPGEVKVTVTYKLTNDNELIINYDACVYKKATPINLTSHPYFNLDGAGEITEPDRSVLDHEITIHADRYVVMSDEILPTGEIAQVNNTLFDLRSPVVIGDRIYNVTDGSKLGYDHSFVLRGPTGKKLAAKVYHPRSGRVMEVYTNQPGVHFYTSNYLDVTGGKEGRSYGQHSAFCLETQNFPDAVNHPNFPDSVLRPGSVYRQETSYKFSTEPDSIEK